MDRVISRVGNSLGFRDGDSTGREYYRVDRCFYSYPRVRSGLTTRAWNLEVAIEHENKRNEWLDEWAKLLHLNAGLRVIIGYHDPQARSKPLPKLRSEASQIRQRTKYAVDAPTLLILRPWSVAPAGWFAAFELRGRKFSSLPNRLELPAWQGPTPARTTVAHPECGPDGRSRRTHPDGRVQDPRAWQRHPVLPIGPTPT